MASDIQLSVELTPGDVKAAASQLQAEIEQVFNSSVDEKLQLAFTRLQQSMEKAYRSAENIKQEMNTLENTKIETPFYSELNKALQDTQAELGKLQERMRKFQETGGNTRSKTFQNMKYDAQQLEETITQLKAEMKGMRDAGESHMPASNTARYQQLVEKLAQVNNQMRVYSMRAREMVNKSTGPTGQTLSRWGKLREVVQRATSAMKRYAVASTGLSRKSISLRGIFSGLNGGLSSFTGGLKKGFWTVMKYAFGLRSLFIVTNKVRNALKDGIKNLVQYSSSFNQSISGMLSSLNYLKNSLATAFEPLITRVAPIIVKFIDMIARALSAVSQFFSALTGRKFYYRAKKVYQDYGASLGGVGGSADSAKEKVEELQKTIAGFDDVEILKGPDKDSSPSSSGGGGGGGGGASPADMFETLPVTDKFKDLAEMLKEAWEKGDFTEIGRMLGEKLRDALNSIDWEPIKKGAEKIAKVIATFINGFVETPGLWEAVGRTIGEGINTSLTFSSTFLRTIHTDSIGKAITTTISNVFKTIDWSLVGETISLAFARLFDFIRGLIEGIDWSNLPYAIVQGIKDFFTGFDWVSFFQSLGALVGAALKAGLELAISSVNLIAMLGEWIAKQITERIDAFREQGMPLGKAIIMGVLQGIWDALVAIGDWVYNNIVVPIVTGFKEGFGIASPSTVMMELGGYLVEGLLQGILNGLIAIGTWIKNNIVDPFINAFKNFFGINGNNSTEMKKHGKAIIEGMLNGIKEALLNIANWVKTNIFDPFINAFKSLFGINSPSTVMKEQGKYIIEGLKEGIKDKISDAREWVREHIFEKIRGGLTDAFDIVGGVAQALRSVGESISEGIKGGADDKKDDIPSVFENIASSIQGTFDGQDWYSIGDNIVVGINNGIVNGWTWLSNTVSNLASSLFNTACRVLGIRSPSRVFRDQVGKMITAGLALGIDNGESDVLSSVSDLADSLVDAMPTEVKLPDIVSGGIIPYDVELSSKQNINSIMDTLNNLIEMLEYNQDNQIAPSELEEIITRVVQRYMGFDFYIGDEQIARHANNGNAKLQRRYNPVMV